MKALQLQRLIELAISEQTSRINFQEGGAATALTVFSGVPHPGWHRS
jgi:hypothetical protein